MRALYEFAAHDNILARIVASTTEIVILNMTVLYDSGKTDIVRLPVTHTAGDRVPRITGTREEFFENSGKVVGLSLDVRGSPIKRGEYFITVFIRRSDDLDVHPLCSCYVTNAFFGGLGFFESNVGGQGHMRVVALGDPAAGLDYTAEPVPAGARWKVRGFYGRLVTDANAANRRFKIDYTDGTNAYGGTGVIRNLVANADINFVGHIAGSQEGGNGFIGGGDQANAVLSLPDTFMVAGDEFAPATPGIQVGDDWGAGFIQVEEWMEE